MSTRITSPRELVLRRLAARASIVWKLARKTYEDADGIGERCKALAEMSKTVGHQLSVWREQASSEELAEYRRIRDEIKEAIARAHGSGVDDMGEAADPAGAEPVN